MKVKQLRGICALILAALLAFTTSALARTKKGDKLLKEAQKAETREQWDRAVELYTQAVDEDPKDPGYLIGMRRARFAAGMLHVEKAREFRSAGNMAEAIAEFQRAILTDPSSSIAMQELRRTQEMLTNPAPNAADANLTPGERAQKEAAERSASLLGLPELKAPVRRVGPLKMNNQPVNILYNTVAGLAGVNVMWDSTWQRPTRGFDIDLPEMPVEQAFDYIALQTRTFWKPVASTAIFVTEESANKRRDYTDTVVKTFFVTNAATPQEFNEIQTALRTITEIRRVYPYVAQKAIVVRGDADAVALAEKLIRDLDKPKAEVVIDVIVMEANSSRTRDLAAALSTKGINQVISFAPREGIAVGEKGGSIGLNNLSRISTGDFSTSLPNMLLQAMMTDGRTKVMSQPQLRATDGQKARLAIGDRIPIASGSFQTGVTGAQGVGVNTTFQFQDVGVIVDVTPTVHSTGEVTLHVELEVSNVKDYIELGSIRQPIVGQNKATADLRLREGEVNILAGALRSQDSVTGSGIPGLFNIPVLGKFLLGSQGRIQDRGELMIAMVPHIVRSPDYSSDNLRGIYAGVDQQLKLNYAPREDEPDAAPSPPGPAPGAPPATAPAPTPPKPDAPKPAAGPGARVVFNPATVTAAANSPLTVNVQIENAQDAFSVTPLRVSWDPALLRLNDIAPGDLLSRDGGRVTSVKDIRNDSGQATLTVSRAAGSPGVTGSGTVAVLTFVAVAPGSGRVTVTEVGLMNSQNQAANVALSAVPVAVQ